MANPLLDALSGIGTVLDTPGSVVRGLLSGDANRAFSGIFDPSQRMSGRDMLNKWGVTDENSGVAGDVGGFVASLATDPLTWAGTGALGKLLGRGGEAAASVERAAIPKAATTTLLDSAPGVGGYEKLADGTIRRTAAIPMGGSVDAMGNKISGGLGQLSDAERWAGKKFSVGDQGLFPGAPTMTAEDLGVADMLGKHPTNMTSAELNEFSNLQHMDMHDALPSELEKRLTELSTKYYEGGGDAVASAMDKARMGELEAAHAKMMQNPGNAGVRGLMPLRRDLTVLKDVGLDSSGGVGFDRAVGGLRNAADPSSRAQMVNNAINEIGMDAMADAQSGGRLYGEYIPKYRTAGIIEGAGQGTVRHETLHGLMDIASRTGNTGSLSALPRAAMNLQNMSSPTARALGLLGEETAAHAVGSGRGFMNQARGGLGFLMNPNEFYAQQLAEKSPLIAALYGTSAIPRTAAFGTALAGGIPAAALLSSLGGDQ